MIREFEAAAKELEAAFERTSGYSHPGVKGQAREHAIARSFLEGRLPRRYSVGSGQILDISGKVSKQQDLVIYDGFNSPVLQNDEISQLLFAEQVLATIEVKSELNRRYIGDIIDKSVDLGNLMRRSLGAVTVSPGFRIPASSPPIVAFGFGFKSTLTLEAVRDEIQSRVELIDKPFWPSGVLVLEDKNGRSGLIVSVNAKNLAQVLLFPTPDSRFVSIETGSRGAALLYFYLLLMQRLELGGIASPIPDYLGYASAAGLARPKFSIGTDALRGTRYVSDGLNLDIDPMLRIQTLLKDYMSNKTLSRDQLVELFEVVITYIPIDMGFREGTVFILDNNSWGVVSPSAIGRSLHQSHESTSDTDALGYLDEFFSLLEQVLSSARELRVVENDTGRVLFLLDGDSGDIRFGWDGSDVVEHY